MEKKKPQNKRSWFSILMIIVLFGSGIGIMLYPTLSDLYVNYQLKQQVSEYNRTLEGAIEDYSERWQKIDAFNRDLTQKAQPLSVTPEEDQFARTLLNPFGTGMIASIEIPRISIDIPIFYGTNEKQLQAGSGYWPGSSLPAGGPSTHTVLTAHTGLVRAKLFTDIDKLENGDVFRIQVLDRTLSYEVDSSKIVNPNEMQDLRIVPGEDLVTLYTCYPYGVNSHRLLVRGHRIPNEEAEVAPVKKAEYWLRQYWIVVVCLALLALLLLIWGICKVCKRKKRSKELKKNNGE